MLKKAHGNEKKNFTIEKSFHTIPLERQMNTPTHLTITIIAKDRPLHPTPASRN